jgi:hypothetical protein
MTPNNEVGICQIPRQCPVLFKILQSPPISAENSALLLQSQCGFQSDGIKPLLCCPARLDQRNSSEDTDNPGLICF